MKRSGRRWRHACRSCRTHQRELVLAAYAKGTRIDELAAQRGQTAMSLYKLLHRIRQALLECVRRTIASGGTRMKNHWHEQIQRYVNGQASAEEAAALQAALNEDAELRALYLDYMNLDVALGAAAEAATIAENGIARDRDIPTFTRSVVAALLALACCGSGVCGFGHDWDAAQTSQPFADAPGRRRRLLSNAKRHRTAFCGTALSVPRVGVAHRLNARSTTTSKMGPVIMKLDSRPTHTMKLYRLRCPPRRAMSAFRSGRLPRRPPTRLQARFSRRNWCMLARDRIALTPQQREAFRARVEKTQARSEELRAKLERETAALAALAKQDRVDEAALVAQLDKVLDVERELKHLHVGLAGGDQESADARTTGQAARDREGWRQATLRKTLANVSLKKSSESKRARERWAASGRDPSDIAKTMEEKVQASDRCRQGHRSRGRTGSPARTT